MVINYNGKIFRSTQNSVNGEVSSETLFHYHQEGNIVWAEYSGGSIKKGMLIALVGQNSELNMRYQHVNISDELMTGTCHSKPIRLDDGRLALEENWKWTSGDMTSGYSVVEEVREESL